MFTSILIPVDGSKHAQKALQVACQLARQNDAILHILHIPEELTHDATLVWGLGAIAIEASRQEREDIGSEMVEKAAESARGQGVEQIKTHLGKGDPARTILHMSKKLEVDAITMGTRGLSDLQGFVIGSVSHKVTHAADCTVITVH
ncbi:universal stress protein [Halomonas sp. Bachu 37]|uniref:universal stress protein n=1 Tax=Halomonas kashgarensis TaxID=3084920 RepID=UPI003216AF9B